MSAVSILGESAAARDHCCLHDSFLAYIMDDDFYSPVLNSTPPSLNLLSKVWISILYASPTVMIAALLALLAIIVATRYLSERPSRVVSGGGRSVWMLPYWTPIIGHGFSLSVFKLSQTINTLTMNSLYEPFTLMQEARQVSISTAGPYGS